VRKSVANHLNDFSKDHPTYMLDLVNKWDLNDSNTGWIVKHACRTLIKKGNQEALKLFRFEKDVKIQLKNLVLDKSRIHLGDTLTFEFEILSKSASEQKLVIDYCIHYYKKNGLSPKVFKLKEIVLEPGQLVKINKKQIFKDFTTRKHYTGNHVLEIMVNGTIYGTQEFQLLT
jgi:hypothetical protein